MRIPYVGPIALLLVACGAPGAPSPPVVAPGAPPALAAPPPAPIAGLPGPDADGGSARSTPDDAAVDEAARAYLDLLVALSPEIATSLGIHARDSELDDYTLAGFEAGLKREEEMLASLRARLGKARLSVSRKIDLELLEHALEVDVRRGRDEQPLVRSPSAYSLPLETIFQMIARPYAPAEERARAVVARLEKIPEVVAAAKANLKNPPEVWTKVEIESLAEVPAFLDQVHAFLAATLHDEPARVAQALTVAHDAFADYGKFLEHELLPRSKGDFAAGRPLFDFLLHESYFLDEDADAILMLGKRVYRDTDLQMTELAKKIDPRAKGWPEITKRLKGKHPTPDDLLPAFRRQIVRARAFLEKKDVVSFPPDDDLVVMETPPFQRSTVTAAYEVAPPFDTATTRGFFFVTPVERSMKPKEREELLRENYDADQADTVVHETYPGHHLQLSFSRRHPSLVRKAVSTNLFSEGWALYVEELMAELGYYSDEERLIQLDWTLVRAARVLIDVGLHTKGMTFDAAVAMLTDQVHLERTLALSEVKRYTGSPTQPLSYLIGREKIFALRREYEKRDPAHFSMKRFHDDLLSHGTIPTKLITEEMLGTTPP